MRPTTTAFDRGKGNIWMATEPDADCDEAWEMAYLDCEHYVNGSGANRLGQPACLSIDECARTLVPAECQADQQS
jgi:hypothetical protein